MKPSPCLHPIFITDQLGHKRAVPCGKCAACLVNKGRERSHRLKQSISRYSYKFLITLTFDDEFLPIARFDSGTQRYYSPFDCDFDGVVYSRSIADLPDSDFNYLDKVNKRYGGLPVLSHRHLILFKKRFRYYFKKYYSHVQLYIYACGEYGPDDTIAHRPHFHLLLGTNSPVRTGILKLCVNYAWSVSNQGKTRSDFRLFGYTHVQRCTSGNASQYVASYLNCNINLPKVLSNAQWRPFSTKSTDGDFVLSRYGQADLRKVYAHPTLYVSEVCNGKYVDSPVPAIYQSRYFPRIPRFNQLPAHGLQQLYRIFNSFSGESEKAYDCVNKYLNDENLMRDYDPVGSWNQSFDGWCFTKSIKPMVIDLVDFCCFKDSDGKTITDEFIKKRNFMRLWYVSRRVCNNSKIVGVSVCDYVNRIIDYWHSFELDKLKRFYSMQEALVDDVLSPIPSSFLLSLYYNTDEKECDYGYYKKDSFGYELPSLDVGVIPCQNLYVHQSRSILLNTTKTKKRNDFFRSRGLKPRPYLPHFSRKIKSFLTV